MHELNVIVKNKFLYEWVWQNNCPCNAHTTHNVVQLLLTTYTIVVNAIMKCSIWLKKHCERAWERELPTPFINHTHKELFTFTGTAYCWSSLGCLLRERVTYIIYLINYTHTHIKYCLPSLVLDLVLVALETAWERDSYLHRSPHQSHTHKALFTFTGTTYSWSSPSSLLRERVTFTIYLTNHTHAHKSLFTFTGTTYSSSNHGYLSNSPRVRELHVPTSFTSPITHVH